eukprot:Mrub_05699.p1 GENE.Mrub_05699~~Mrub_05699.p1  ORF type:complete len:282 (+),score=58.46 Mrub_05699:39-884(+)
MNKEEQIRYNRHTHMFGEEAAANIIKSKILIINLNNANAECCKNLGLTGMQVSIYDPNPITQNDSAFNLFYSSEDVGKNKADVVAVKLQAMNPLNKGIDTVTDLNNIDMSLYAVCIYGIVQFGDINSELVAKLENNGLKYILNAPFGFGGLIYSSLIYEDDKKIEEETKYELRYVKAIKETKNEFLSVFRYYIDADFINKYNSVSELCDETIKIKNMKGNKLKRFESLKGVINKGYGKQIITTGSIIGGQISNEVLNMFKKDSKVKNGLKFYDGLAGQYHF